jgi:thiamine-phosphate pyrophosphorylase
MDIDADGLHIGQDDMNLVEARALLGEEKIIGVSVHTAKEALQAQRNGADYLGVGAVFSSNSKNYAQNISIDELKQICKNTNLPVVAMGGINQDNIPQLRGSGVMGVGVISTIMAAPNIAKATRQLKETVKKYIGTDYKMLLRKISPKAIIFDMDGTLLDSLPAWDNLAEEFLLKRHIQPPANIHQMIEKLSLEDSAQYFSSNFPVVMTGEDILDVWHEQMLLQYANHINLKPGVEEFLSIMHNLGIKMCVATLTDKDLAEIALERLGLRKYLQFVITVGEAGKEKTNPKIYIDAAQKMGFAPQDCMVFEDAIYAVSTAKNAGFSVCGIIDRHSIGQLDKLHQICDLTIDSFELLL